MKKFLLVFLLSFVVFSVLSPVVNAQGLVPCGIGAPTMENPNESERDKKPIVPNPNFRRCELDDIASLALNIFNFLVWQISTPLAGLVVAVGGFLMIVSGGPGGKNPVTGIASPNLYNTAKGMVTGALVALLLIFGSWLIMNVLLSALGVQSTYRPGF